MPTSPAPTRLIVWWVRGSVRVAAVAARCRWRRAQAARPGDLERPRERWSGRGRCTSAGSSAQPRWPITPTTSIAPRRSASRAPGTADATATAGPVAGHAGVDVQVHPRPARGRRDGGEVLRTRYGDIDPPRTAVAKSASTGFSQLSNGAVEPGVAQGPRLGERGDAERGGAVRERRPGHVDGAVAEPVGLHHRHQVAGRAVREQAVLAATAARSTSTRRGTPDRARSRAARPVMPPAASTTGPYGACGAPVTSAQ